jgi:RimJ/RimL family protein N-acetyltransferase
MSAPDVTLRPATLADLDEFDRRFDSAEGAGEHQWFGFTSRAMLRQMWEERRLLRGDHNLLAVDVDGELAGRVDYFVKAWGRLDTSTCWEIAIALFPEARGRGVGTRAQALLVGYLFDHTRAERIQLATDVDNAAEIGAAKRVGFQVEGRLRRANWRGGRWHDLVLLSLLRDEWPGGERALDRPA